MVSYKDETERKFGIDKLTFMVLHDALKRAWEFIRMEEMPQNREHNCADYSKPIRPRNKIRKDFSDYFIEMAITEGEVVGEVEDPSPDIYSGTHSSNPQNCAPPNWSGFSSNRQECLLCLEAKPLANICFYPCGHRCLCEECKDNFRVGDNCPKCGNRRIDEIIKLSRIKSPSEKKRSFHVQFNFFVEEQL